LFGLNSGRRIGKKEVGTKTITSTEKDTDTNADADGIQT